MKVLILIIISFLLSLPLFSQTLSHVEFYYDAAGNRTAREVIYLKTTAADTTQQLKESYGQQVADSVEYKSSIGSRQITIFPNPTRGLLTIAMEIADDDSPVKLELFSLAGESILQRTIRQPKTTVDLSGQPAGSYILSISLAGSHRSWKIIKE
ncbi:MAG: T9SS type A sorting domain-containing protein [Bacteroidales bacterium]|nr:T9SS type A sorting domain-containing protein [Bacteroidales bacterium]MDD4742895.1 T9SS type A sorting domain-containing protein [Bacteroidales bacterium]